MAKYSNIKVENNKDSAVVIGPGSIVFSQKDNDKSKNISSDKQVWDKVVEEIKEMQKEIRNLPDEEEEIRDRELIPLASTCKGEAEEIQKKPEKEKTKFLETLGKITDIANKSMPVLEKIKPFSNRIFEMITGSN